MRHAVTRIEAATSRVADVDDPRKPHVVDRAEPVGRLLNDHRPLRQVHDGYVVDGVGVRGKEQRVAQQRLLATSA